MPTVEQAYDAMNPPGSAIASAAKRGRNPAFPYVPVIIYPERARTHNPVTGFAFATRQEAIACAQDHLDRLRSTICAQLAEPRHRALREQYGLPREL